MEKSSNSNLFGVLSVVVGGISLLINFWGAVGIAAVILGAIALEKHEPRKVMPIIGIIVGAFSILYALVAIGA